MNAPLTEQPKIQSYVESYGTYTVKSTRYSTAFYLPDGRRWILSETSYGKKILGLMGRVKAEARRSATPFEKPDLVEPKLFAARAEIVDRVANLYCYDKGAAYATAAAALNIISLDTFETLVALPKQFRLAILGSLGTHKYIEEYVDGKRVFVGSVRDETLWRKWLLIVTAVSEEMVRQFETTKALAYWFDALYSFHPLCVDNTFKEERLHCHVKCDGKALNVRVNNQQHLFIPCQKESEA